MIDLGPLSVDRRTQAAALIADARLMLRLRPEASSFRASCSTTRPPGFHCLCQVALVLSFVRVRVLHMFIRLRVFSLRQNSFPASFGSDSVARWAWKLSALLEAKSWYISIVSIRKTTNIVWNFKCRLTATTTTN